MAGDFALWGNRMKNNQTTHTSQRSLSNFPSIGRLLLPLFICLQAFTARADESYHERQNRIYREDQRSRDNAAYLQNWRGGGQAQNQYAAIAYSKSTGKWGYGHGFSSLTGAKQEALRRCGTSDAGILCWAQNGYSCALAVGPNSHGWAYASTARAARTTALANANRIAPGAQVVMCVRGNQ